MGPPYCFAPDEAPAKRDGGVGEIIERQDECCGEMIHCGKLQQKPAKQKPDRQATHVAEKDLRHRPVERRETGSRAKQGGRDDGGQRSERTEKAKHQHLRGSKSGVSFKKMSSTEMAEFTARRAAGESETAIAADLKRRKRA